MPNNGCSASGTRTSWERGVGGATKRQRSSSAAYSCCAPKREAARASAPAYRLGVVHCNGRDTCATAALPRTHSAKTAEKKRLVSADGYRASSHTSRAKGTDGRAHNKNPQPRAATKPNCEKTQSRAARCCRERGCAPVAGSGPGGVCVWWERLGHAYLPAWDEHQNIPVVRQKWAVVASQFITHTEPDAKAAKRRYISAARSMTPSSTDSVSQRGARFCSRRNRRPQTATQISAMSNTIILDTISWF